jgi:hypothetical protein
MYKMAKQTIDCEIKLEFYNKLKSTIKLKLAGLEKAMIRVEMWIIISRILNSK